jgi:hypothetical protein
MNEETFIEKSPMVDDRQAEFENQGHAWKEVTLGGVSGILMGAGMLYAGQVIAKELEEEETPGAKISDSGDADSGLQVATVSDDLSFGEAFAAARAEVGPGGVFHWHGGIYNTYTAEEWNTMTVEQKHDFAQQVEPEIHPDELSTPTDADTHVVVHHVYHHTNSTPEENANQSSEDVQIADNNTDEGDVHIVGYGNVHGHLAVGMDFTGDGDADIAIIDVDDNGHISDPDIVVDRDGNMATVGEIVSPQNPSMENYTDNQIPDVDTSDSDLLLMDV